MAGNKDFKPVIVELRNQGWDVTQTSQGHWRATPPDSSKQIVHFSASNDRHALKNTIQDLRRSGFAWPPPPKRSLRDESPSPDTEFEEAPIPTTPAPEAAMVIVSKETAEDKMERLFRELKEAKSYLALTNEHLVECRHALESAQRAFAEAEAEQQKATEALKLKKGEFDAAFESAA